MLYGAIAARTENLRLGYGVRLMPAPYNHPVRTAESVAVLDLISNGRVDFGTGRSSTRLELEGFGIDPHATRAMWLEAVGHVVGCWANDEYEFTGDTWSMPKRRVLPEEIKRKFDIYREAQRRCTDPIGKFINSTATTFTMMNMAPTRAEAEDVARRSFEWYPKAGARIIGSLAEWMAERDQELGNYSYAQGMHDHDKDGSLDLLTLDIAQMMGACACGTPDDAIEICRRCEAAGVDLLLCLVNPYDIAHEKVMQTIELVGKHVIPHFA
ncbi:unannotated protein [freshwater metagenome]|uniref:Unannotated protein n=1 Tax=freshwater metagenome TaxID=449393 RepID=A0A6J7DZ27_9ZZZZ